MMKRDTRQAIIDACLWMRDAGLVQGTSGNVSVRTDDGMLITPSGIAYEALTTDALVHMPLNGSGTWEGHAKPSSEWRFHHDILAARADTNAIVHTHSPHATALSMTRQGLPPAHYMIAAFGGADVRCADYALFGTQALSDAALAALQDRKACLLANHGAITLGETLDKALALAMELETLSRQYLLSLSAGGPVLLSQTEITEALQAFRGYGPKA